jgi:hypothetical protein
MNGHSLPFQDPQKIFAVLHIHKLEEKEGGTVMLTTRIRKVREGNDATPKLLIF